MPASANLSAVSMAAPGWWNLPKRVPVSAKPQEGSSIRNSSRAAGTRSWFLGRLIGWKRETGAGARGAEAATVARRPGFFHRQTDLSHAENDTDARRIRALPAARAGALALGARPARSGAGGDPPGPGVPAQGPPAGPLLRLGAGARA